MTAERSHEASLPIVLPERPSEAETGSPRAVRAARTREAEPLSPMAVAWIQHTAPGLVSGSSLWHAQPPSMASYWSQHCASARYFEAGLLRWPRYAWGAVHIVILMPIYLLGWVTHSIPLFALVVAVTALGLWLW